MFEVLHEGNFLLYAAKTYDNVQCLDTLEFYEDLARFKYIKRLLNKFHETGELKERLVLNHIVILYNVFGVTATTRMLFLKLRGQEVYLKPFLVFLGYMPEKVLGIGIENKTIVSADIESNIVIEKALEGLVYGS